MRTVFLLVSLLWVGGLCAQTTHLYKSVHDDGTVTYSDTKPPGGGEVTEMNLHGGGGAIEQQGRKRMDEMRAVGEAIDEQRAAEAEALRKREKAIAEARKEVADAERDLVNIRQSKHNATDDRIALAEQRLRLARQRLKEVQGR